MGVFLYLCTHAIAVEKQNDMENLVFLGLNVHAWITLITVLGIFVVMARTRIPAVVVFLGALTVLLLFGVVSEEGGMAGFGSEPVVVHGAFFVVISGLMQSGVPYWLSKHLFGYPKNHKQALLRLMTPIAVLGGILNSVNVVALFVDVVIIWAHKLKAHPSRLLMPLSYAATLGGSCTLIGNSSNLVIASLYAKQTGTSMHMFTPFLPGLFCTVIGIITIILLRNRISKRESPGQSFESIQDFTVELLVPTGNEFIGKAVGEAGLRYVRGGLLIEIVRSDGEIITPVAKTEVVKSGDRLIYSGQIHEILEFKQSHGLVAADHQVYNISEIDNNRRMRMAYVRFGSDLMGTRMSDNDFEKHSNLVLVAIARQGQRIDQQPREVILDSSLS